MAQTCALIAPVQPVLHQASCSNETIQIALNHYEMQQYISLASKYTQTLRDARKHEIMVQ